MTKLDYLKLFLNNRAYNEKAAIQSIITIQFEDEDSSGQFKKYPYAVFVENNRFNVVVEGSTHTVNGEVNEPLFYMDEILELPGDFHPVLQGKAVTTTFGLLLFNVILFWECFGKTQPYLNQEFTKPVILKILETLMVDNPPPGEAVPEGKASVDQCLKFSHNCQFLEGLGSHFIKPGGVDALTVSPEVIKLRDRLFKEHKDELNDPVVATSIIDQCVALDMKIVMSGPSRKFFIAKKFIDNSRKRMFISFGIEPNASGDGWVLLPNSLAEGWDPNFLADYINTAVEGSYSRSMSTGEGGARVKETLRLIGRTAVSEDIVDCGTPVTETVTILPTNKGYWVGSWIQDGKVLIQLTAENLDRYVNKPVQARVPQFCTLKDGYYCKTCCGEGLGALGHRLSSEVVLIPTRFMLARMKAHHTAGSKTNLLDLEVALK